MLDIHRLRLLRELSHRGTLAAVADAMAYSPSAVSQQLSKLQAEVGVVLLERVGRGVRLTPEARMLVTHTEAVLERLERAETELARSTRQVAGTLSVAAFQSATMAWFPEVLTRLAKRHPGLQLDIAVREPDDALPGLLAGDFDVIVDEEYPNLPLQLDPRLHREPVARDPLTLVVPAAWDHIHDIHDLSAAPWVLEPPGTLAHSWSLAHCRQAGFEPRTRFFFDDLVTRMLFVETGHAASLLPELAAVRTNPRLRVLDLEWSPVRDISTLARAGTIDHPAIVSFREVLHSVAREHGSALPQQAGEPPTRSSEDQPHEQEHA